MAGWFDLECGRAVLDRRDRVELVVDGSDSVGELAVLVEPPVSPLGLLFEESYEALGLVEMLLDVLSGGLGELVVVLGCVLFGGGPSTSGLARPVQRQDGVNGVRGCFGLAALGAGLVLLQGSWAALGYLPAARHRAEAW